jgi:aspartate carbamoyltransferase catalytic subunit
MPLKTNKLIKASHLLSIDDVVEGQIELLLDLAGNYARSNREEIKSSKLLQGKTQVNLFFEPSTRTQSSFEIAGMRLGANVVTMSVASSSMTKGETLIDTATTISAMQPDFLVVRHASSGAVELLSQKLNCSVINAGDGQHEHPTQALLDALTIRRHYSRIEGLVVAICGDILHSRVARSNIHCLSQLGARVRVVAPSTLLPTGIANFGVEVFRNMQDGIKDADVVMMLRLQQERMSGAFVPSLREFYHFYGLTEAKLKMAKPGALVMHPGPMNRGVEIDSSVADGAQSVIREQVEMGVAVRMAVLDALNRNGRGQ